MCSGNPVTPPAYGGGHGGVLDPGAGGADVAGRRRPRRVPCRARGCGGGGAVADGMAAGVPRPAGGARGSCVRRSCPSRSTPRRPGDRRVPRPTTRSGRRRWPRRRRCRRRSTPGELTVEQLDVLRHAARSLDAGQRARLLDDASLPVIAVAASPEEFRRVVRQRVRSLLRDDGVGRLEQQRRDVSLRSWVDGGSGMVRFTGQLDPETGTRFLNRIRLKAEELFHDRVPDTCPTDPQLRQAHLSALALVALTEAKHGHPGVSEVIVVIDADTVDGGRHPDSMVRHQYDVELPVASIRRMLCDGVVTPVAVRDGVVLDVGRSRRLATRAQRRALRVMHPTCAIPGCSGPVRPMPAAPHPLVATRRGHGPRQPGAVVRPGSPPGPRPRLAARPRPGHPPPHRHPPGRHRDEPRTRRRREPDELGAAGGTSMCPSEPDPSGGDALETSSSGVGKE